MVCHSVFIIDQWISVRILGADRPQLGIRQPGSQIGHSMVRYEATLMIVITFFCGYF